MSDSSVAVSSLPSQAALDVLFQFQASCLGPMVEAWGQEEATPTLREAPYTTLRQRFSSLSPVFAELEAEISGAEAYVSARSALQTLQISGLIADLKLAEDTEDLRLTHDHAARLLDRATAGLSHQQRQELDKLIAGHVLDLPLSLYIRFAEIGKLVDRLFDEEMIEGIFRRGSKIMIPAALFVIACFLLFLIAGDAQSAGRIGGAGVYGLLSGALLAFLFDSFRRSWVRRRLALLGMETGLSLQSMRPSRVYAVMQGLKAELLKYGLDVEALSLQEIKDLYQEITHHRQEQVVRFGLPHCEESFCYLRKSRPLAH